MALLPVGRNGEMEARRGLISNRFISVLASSPMSRWAIVAEVLLIFYFLGVVFA